MSDEKKEVLLRIRIDEAVAKKQIVDFQKQINATKQEQQELTKAVKAAGTATEEQTAKQVELKQRLADLTRQQNVQIKAIEHQQKADKAAVGSINQLRAQLASLTTQWNDLSEEERENADIGGKIEKATKATSDKLKELEGRVGDTRRNVGNYTESILKATDGSGKLGEAISLAKEAYSELKGVVSEAKEALVKEVQAKIAAKEAALAKAAAEGTSATATNAATTASKLNKAAIIGNVGALKLLKFALIATGVGAFVVLLGGLISFLTRTQEGVDLVSRKTKGFTTVIGVLTDKLSAIGKATVNWFDDIHDLGDFLTKLGGEILDNLISRLKGFMVIYEGFKSGDTTKIRDGFVQVGTGITDATAKTKALVTELNEVRKAGEAIEKENQRIRDSEIQLTKERSKSRAEVEKMKMIADDTTKSEKERIAAAQKAAAIERGILEKEIELQQRKVNNVKAEQALTNNMAADNQLLADEEAKLDELRAASTTRQIELQNKLNGLRKESSDKAAATAEALSEAEYKALQRRLEDEKAAIENKLLLAKENSDERLALEVELNEKEREIALSAKDLTENQKALLQTQYDQRELQARKEHTQKIIDVAKEESEKLKKQKEDEFRQTQQYTDEYYAQQRLLAAQSHALGKTTEQAYQAEVDVLQLQSLENQLQNAKEYGESTVEIEQQIADFKIGIRKQEADTKQAIAESEYQLAVTVAQGMADLAMIIAGQSSRL